MLESENIQTKFSLESIKNWLLKVTTKTEEVCAKIDTRESQQDSAHLDEEIAYIRKQFSSIKELIVPAAKSICLPKIKSCNKGEETFAKKN